MFAKVLLVAFLAAFALQAPADAASTLRTRAEIKGIIDDVIDGILKLWDWVTDNLDALLDKIIAVGQQAIEAAKEKLLELIEYLKTKIAELVEQAQAIGADVTECVQGVEENVNDLYNKAIDEFQKCLEDPKKKFDELVKLAKAKFDDVMVKFDELKKKFEDCNGGWGCMVGVAIEAAAVASGIPGEVTSIIDQAKQLTETIIDEVPTCVAGKGAELKKDLDVILSTVTECIKDKLPIPE